jgi:hypothetical protein
MLACIISSTTRTVVAYFDELYNSCRTVGSRSFRCLSIAPYLPQAFVIISSDSICARRAKVSSLPNKELLWSTLIAEQVKQLLVTDKSSSVAVTNTWTVEIV